MIFEQPTLDAAELAVIERIDDLKAQLRHAVSDTPRRWQGLLRRSALARAIRGSNSIEGYDVTVDDALAAVDRDDPVDATDVAWHAITGYRTAMTFVLQLARDPSAPWSAEILKSLHFMMLQHDLDKNPGRWRSGPIYVHSGRERRIVYEGPDAGSVPALIAAMLKATRDGSPRTPALVRGAMAHLNLVMIHPFSDGNGRMARCLQTLVLTRAGTLAPEFSSIEEYLGDHTPEYYDVLARVGGGRWHPERDARPWLRFCLTAHFRQAATILRRSRELERLWGLLESELSRTTLPTRIIFALADAASGLRVRNSTYRRAAEISEQLASRELRAAVAAGYLLAEGERRGRSYLAAGKLREIARRTKEGESPDEDPFGERTHP
jgi:Fic family protein